MAIAMVAMLAFGGTYAYFTATTSKAAESSKLHTATVVLGNDATATLTSSVPARDLLPGDTVTLTASISNASTVATDIYVQVILDKTAITNETAKLEFSEFEGWTPVSYTGYSNIYKKADVAASTAVSLTAEAEFKCDANSVDATADSTAMNKDISVTARFASIQAGISETDAVKALIDANCGFVAD